MPTARNINDINAWWARDAYYGSVSGCTIHYGGTYVNEGSESHVSFLGGNASGSAKAAKELLALEMASTAKEALSYPNL
jgi:hypothetical protein